MTRRAQGARARRLAAACLAAAGLAACAKKLPPPGGRPDQEPPRLAAARPESGAVGVPRTGALEIEFTEPMNERATAASIQLAPYARAAKFEWDGRVFRYVLADSLGPAQTYNLVVGPGARDVRGNALPGARQILFTTALSMPPGRLGGDLVARGHPPQAVVIWAYRDDLGHAPDSTARDFDALGVVGPSGRFVLRGLPVPSRWRLYAFHDVNRTQTFEPGTDNLTPLAEPAALTAEAPHADSLRLMSVDPTAQAVARGEIVDPDSLARQALRFVVEGADTTVSARPRWDNPVVSGPFQIPLAAGRYRAWLYRDVNRNGRLDTGEPRGEIVAFELEPAEEKTDLRFVAPPAVAAPPDTTAAPGGGP